MASGDAGADPDGLAKDRPLTYHNKQFLLQSSMMDILHYKFKYSNKVRFPKVRRSRSSPTFCETSLFVDQNGQDCGRRNHPQLGVAQHQVAVATRGIPLQDTADLRHGDRQHSDQCLCAPVGNDLGLVREYGHWVELKQSCHLFFFGKKHTNQSFFGKTTFRVLWCIFGGVLVASMP